ncbi:MAG: hypothetical protein QM765_12670 [Myxococcales bacterium]
MVLLNELTGDCGSDTSSRCNTEQMSLASRPSGAGGCGASGTAPTCAWAQNRYRPNEKVIVVNGVGTWAEMTVSPMLSSMANGRRGLALTAAPAHLDAGQPRRGFVSTPDRVFYRLHGDAVERGQCWGPIGSPPTTTDACVAGTDGSGWQVLARQVSDFRLRYFTGRGFPLVGDLSKTRRVDLTFQQWRKTASDAVTHDSLLRGEALTCGRPALFAARAATRC